MSQPKPEPDYSTSQSHFQISHKSQDAVSYRTTEFNSGEQSSCLQEQSSTEQSTSASSRQKGYLLKQSSTEHEENESYELEMDDRKKTDLQMQFKSKNKKRYSSQASLGNSLSNIAV